MPPLPRPVSDADLELYSSAITLSDMEIFVFPDLLYPLVLANLMSPAVWSWRADPWFARFDRLTPYRRVLRLKQFIMDHYAFNLDLDTWGLTTQARELARFAPWMSPETIARSNALFGYEGDRFYFDLDIRRHFGLDRYTHDTIPYWKTETVEAMDAFRFRPGRDRGAGECVSLSTLYAAALHALCGIPLEQIYLLATPLHSQNFVDVADGILTNNRRLVTKAMWFNGTALSAKARRALEHEQITIVSHVSGWAHSVYHDSTIDPAAYATFRQKLRAFLQTPPTPEIVCNFLRQAPAWQTAFQFRHALAGRDRFVPAERAYALEPNFSFKLSDSTRPKLLDEIDPEDYFAAPLPARYPVDRLDAFFREHPALDLDAPADRAALAAELATASIRDPDSLVADLRAFCHLDPRWPKDTIAPPSADQRPETSRPATCRLETSRPTTFSPLPPLPPGLSRDEIAARLSAARPSCLTADLAFYAYRDLLSTDPRPHLKAALERSPVCAAGAAAENLDDSAVADLLASWPSESIYSPTRLAQPDEVWNSRRGDGLEKALTLAAILHARHPQKELEIRADGATATLLSSGSPSFTFPFASPLPPLTWPLAAMLAP